MSKLPEKSETTWSTADNDPSTMDEHSPLVDSNSGCKGSKSSSLDGNSSPMAVSANQLVTRRHLLVWPVAFLFMTAHQLTFNSFSQYVYIKLQNDNFPGIHVNKTIAFCEVNESSINFKIQQDVQQKAATWGIYLYLAGGVTSIFSNLVLGSATDRFGRKFLFILPCFGTMLRTGMAMVGMHYNLPLSYYVAGYILEGCTGQIFNIIQIGYIYISDITSVGKQRSIGIVIIELAFGLGSAAPTLAVGYILETTGSFLIPFYISLGILTFTLFLMLLLPETFPKEIRNQRKYSSRIENLKDSLDLYISKENKGRRWMYIVTLLVFALTTYDLLGRISVEGLYLLNFPFCWDPTRLGIFGALRIGFQQILGMTLVKVFHLCMSDEMIAIIGCVSYGASFLLESIATNDLMMYIVAVVGTCGLLTIPMIRSIMSQMTSSQKQGAVFASIAAVETAMNLLAAITSQSVYIATVKLQRGFVFMLFAGFNVVCFTLMIIFTVGSKWSSKKYTNKGP